MTDRTPTTPQRYSLAYRVLADRWVIYRYQSDEKVAGPFKSRKAAMRRLAELEPKP